MTEVDINRYEFNKIGTSDSGIDLYARQIRDYTIELTIAANVYTLSCRFKEEKEEMIANRYKIDSHSEMDFLILKGRIGYLFTNE